MERDGPYRRNTNRVSRGKWFFLGMSAGLILAACFALGLTAYVVKHPGMILNRFAGRPAGSVVSVVSGTLQSIPRETVREKQEEIIQAVQLLSDAYTEDRLPPDAFRKITSRIFRVVSDRQVTSGEIDDLLRLIRRYSRRAPD